MQRAAAIESQQHTIVSHRREPDGALVFGYRTRSGRAMAWFPTFIMAVPLFANAVTNSVREEPRHDAIWPTLAWSFVMALIAALAWWTYFTACVRLDERGIHKHTLFDRSFLAWGDVRELVQQPDRGHVVRADKKSLSIGMVFPTDFQLLRNEIARRTGLTWQESNSLKRTRASNV
jgi:hypothetical protein